MSEWRYVDVEMLPAGAEPGGLWAIVARPRRATVAAVLEAITTALVEVTSLEVYVSGAVTADEAAAFRAALREATELPVAITVIG